MHVARQFLPTGVVLSARAIEWNTTTQDFLVNPKCLMTKGDPNA
jgi:hypothetical protein